MTESQTPLPTKRAATTAMVERAATAPSGGVGRRWDGLSEWLGWHIWAILGIAMTGGLGLYAFNQLVRLPSLPECESTIWMFAPASKRIYCGQSYADAGTADDLLVAIDLVNVLGSDHPLRDEADKQIAAWTTEILDLGEAEFQAGNFDEALEIADRVPKNIDSRRLVENRKITWQELWNKGTIIVERVTEFTIEAEWQAAEIVASKLANLPNEYWAKERYEATLKQIRAAKEEYERLGFARAAVSEKASTEQLIDALEKALSIEANSLFYERAQELAMQAGKMLVVRGQQAAKREDWSGVLEVASALPGQMGLEEHRQDFKDLGRAGLNAKRGTITTLEASIDAVSYLGKDRPLYDVAQNAIARWELEIEDIRHLTTARNRAGTGRLEDLRAAVAEAGKIAPGNPRRDEAQQEIWRWTARIQTIEDRPILSRARQQAQGGTIRSWKQAISTANRIAPRRTLHGEAQGLVRQWSLNIQRAEDAPILERARALSRGNRLREAIATANQIGRGRILHSEAQGLVRQWGEAIQRAEDQPILDRARALAQSSRLREAISTANQIAAGRILHSEAQGLVRQWGEAIQRAEDQPILDRAWALAQSNRLEEAIATANQVAPGRVLHSQAQGLVNRWRVEAQAAQDIERAYQVASSGSPWALAQAIRFADRVPANTPFSNRSRQAIEDWSRRIFELARQESATDLAQAIQIANLVPPNSQVHQYARQQVADWQTLLNPPAPEPESVPTSDPALTPAPGAEVAIPESDR
ncbi:MAG: hypothetical protein AAFY11_01950 [Cyanobacteria bacterium J06641_5]